MLYRNLVKANNETAFQLSYVPFLLKLLVFPNLGKRAGTIGNVQLNVTFDRDICEMGYGMGWERRGKTYLQTKKKETEMPEYGEFKKPIDR